MSIAPDATDATDATHATEVEVLQASFELAGVRG
jgi:hypothetical protein